MKKLITIAILFGVQQTTIAQYGIGSNSENTSIAYNSGKDSKISTTTEGVNSYTPDAVGVLAYSKQLVEPSQEKDRLFDKTLIWFYKNFFHSYDKIISSNKETGIITGRTFFYSDYKVPDKTDSTRAYDYSNYNFEWTAKIENGRVTFNISNFFINKNNNVTPTITQKIVVTKASTIPFGSLLKSDRKMEQDWNLSKAYLMKNVDELIAKLNEELQSDEDLHWKF